MSQEGVRARTGWALGALGLLSVCMIFAACVLGSAQVHISDLITSIREWLAGLEQSRPAVATILFKVRMPRALLSYAVGAALAVSGTCMQGIFKNPMADPHVLGVSSGAALGAAIAMILHWQASFLGFGALSIAAFAGGALAVLLVLSLAGGRTDSIRILLAGIAISSLLSALLSAIMLLNREEMESVYLWTMGSFSSAVWSKVAITLPVTILGTLALSFFARDLNVMLLGEAEARSLGIRVERVRLIVLALSTIITATAVSMCGVIGFVGLMVPHAVRLVTGPDHRSLLPVGALAGGLFLLIMDTLARTVAMPLELPVGLLTSALGCPFFLILLRRNQHAHR